MCNDRNGTWDEILDECCEDYVEAMRITADCLKRLIGEFTENDPEKQFYTEVLEDMLKL